MFCFKNLLSSEVLCLKESEQTYYAFLCSDLLSVTRNQMILNYDLINRQDSIWKTIQKKYEIMTCATKIHYFIFLMTGYLLLLKSLYYKTHPMQICVITSYAVVGYYL